MRGVCSRVGLEVEKHMYTLLRVGMSPRSNITIITIVDYYTKSPKVCGHMYITKLQWCGMCLSTKVYVM